MGRTRTRHSLAPLCPDCSGTLEPVDGDWSDSTRYACPICRGVFRVERVEPAPASSAAREVEAPAPSFAPAGTVKLWWRAVVLWVLEKVYWTGTIAMAATLLACGGAIKILVGWVRDEIAGWGDVVEALGGAWFRVETNNPDADLGPVLSRVDAPLLFEAIDVVSRRLGVKPPGQVRLSYLPCCGVVAWNRSRALLIGLPLLRILTRAEMRAILAHELAHLARGDATRAARRARFVEGLERAVERREELGLLRGPLGAWARYCLREASWLIQPVAWGQEARADRFAALVAGGGAAASALVKTAIIQPLFREVLEYYDPAAADANLYAFFRAFWFRLPTEIRSAMRMRLLADDGPHDPAHPPLADRLILLQSYPDHVHGPGDAQPANTFLGDMEIFEQMLHNRLFASTTLVEPSVFHRTFS
ncbi:M48 family metallopeptidase [Paludisphaera mucosa]|uniref:M48 family metallopeptidase n=1 Tax=Paludisphaera mucosa TaxID=3030827 RepID=A0ABT6FAD3_9BACT|nr:M48 family metallopeptidase [Paludisphaera mucosa]MDG3004552.1 M48 family metallopeptidase [Paludisphaera mucosa]